MKMRGLGRSGIQVAPFGFGGNVFGWTVDEKTSFSLLDRFTEAGFNLIDTADIYSTWVPGHEGGESETLIGRWLKKSGKRNRVVIATKVGMEMKSGKKGLSAEHILKSAEDSLRRLGTDRIDLYQSHCDDESVPMEETLGAYAKLIRAGKVRAIGASNFTAPRLRLALETSSRHGLPRYETLQPRYNLCDRKEFESFLQPLCESEGLGVLPYYSLASGFLTGKYRSAADLNKSQRGPGVAARLLESGQPVLKALDSVAARFSASPTQVAIAWLNRRGAIAAPLASATSVAQLEEIIKGAQLELDQDSVNELEQASAVF
jgi:aryl-alcohol dehydrogenase-like predicted oxidoreductase